LLKKPQSEFLVKFNKIYIALGLGLATWGASAQTTATIGVSASVSASCNIAASALAFGTYDPLSATVVNGNSTVAVTCSQGSTPKIELDLGANASGTQRRLRDTGVGGVLNYGLYKPSSNAAGAACAYTAAWGAGAANALITTAATDLSARSYNICGQIPIGQNAPVGTGYADAVAVTVTF
jgi:spore coat protein U-like protein